MKEKFLIAFDMDGTLLRKDNTIGEKSKEIVQKLVQMGNYVTIASGRPNRVITPYYDALGMNGPVVCYNGAKVYSPHDPHFPTFKKMFKKEYILRFLKDFGYDKIENIMAEDDTRAYINKYDPILDSFFHPEGMEIITGNLMEKIQTDTYIFIIGMKNHDYDERLVKCAFQFPNIGLRFWGGAESKFSELYFLNTSKTSGLEIARKDLNLDKDHVIVIGDADNDVEMLTEYPNSIAMVNGEKQVKERAHFISDFDNNHDGAAQAVLKLYNQLVSKGE